MDFRQGGRLRKNFQTSPDQRGACGLGKRVAQLSWNEELRFRCFMVLTYGFSGQDSLSCTFVPSAVAAHQQLLLFSWSHASLEGCQAFEVGTLLSR